MFEITLLKAVSEVDSAVSLGSCSIYCNKPLWLAALCEDSLELVEYE